MYWDHQESFGSSTESSCPSFSDAHSLNSFYSQPTDAGSDLRTPPPSTRRSSLDSSKIDNMKFEEMDFAGIHTPPQHGPTHSLTSANSMPNLGSGYMGNSMMFHSGPIIHGQGTYSAVDNVGSFHSNHELQIYTPSLDMDLSSPVSCMDSYPVTMSFVDPLQTTFVKSFDQNSPMRPLQFHSPASDIDFDLSPAGSLNMHLQYEDVCRSAMTTPSRSSTSSYRSSSQRQPIAMPIRTSAALQQVQSQSCHERKDRKQMVRKMKKGPIIDFHAKAQHHCSWADCDRSFKRSEHLKRHEASVHRREFLWQCEFCKQSPFNRQDNLKEHYKRHMDPSGAKRTPYAAGARLRWEEMDKGRKGTSDQVVKKAVSRSKMKASFGMGYTS